MKGIVAQDFEFAEPVKDNHFIFAADDGHGVAKAGVFNAGIGFNAIFHFKLSCK